MSFRPLTHQAGSAAWVLDERVQASSAVLQEVNDFAVSAADHMEWINEHMAGILKCNSLTITEISKTPGKLRCKTPMTARRHNLLEERAPLTDVFASAPNAHPSPAHNTIFYQQVSNPQSAEDKENRRAPLKTMPDPLMEDNERSVKIQPPKSSSAIKEQVCQNSQQEFVSSFVPSRTAVAALSPKSGAGVARKPAETGIIDREQTRRSETIESFVSAKQSPNDELSVGQTLVTHAGKGVLKSNTSGESKHNMPQYRVADCSQSQDEIFGAEKIQEHEAEFNSTAYDGAQHGGSASRATSPLKSESDGFSDTSSPERPILRKKSSLSFATLPARETLLPKKSMGTTVSRASYIDASRSMQPGKSSLQESAQIQQQFVASKGTAENHLTMSREPEVEATETYTEDDRPEAVTHSKTSTQRLHERITMLSKARPAQSLLQNQNNKVIHPSNTSSDKEQVRSSPRKQLINDNDWLQPASPEHTRPVSETGFMRFTEPRTTSSGLNPPLENQMASQKENEALSQSTGLNQAQICYPTLPSSTHKSNTPVGSPTRKTHADGPLSASKAKLFDMFKSARGMFTSSQPQNLQAQASLADTTLGNNLSNMDTLNEAHTFGANANAIEENQSHGLPSAQMQGQQDQFTNVESEVPPQLSFGKQPEYPNTQDAQNVSEGQHGSSSTSQPSKQGGFRHVRATPSQEQNTKIRPAPVSVRVASQRMGQNAPSTGPNSSMQEGFTSSLQQRQPATLNTKSSSSSIRSGVAGTIKSNSSANGRPRALEAAARKKEQDEREAQRKADQKRELERRREAKTGQDRRALQEQKTAEQQATESRQTAQRQAAEQRRMEMLKKTERVPRPESSLASQESAFVREQTVVSRTEQRFPNKTSSSHDAARLAVPHINPARPPKRYFQPEEDEPTRVYGNKPAGLGLHGSLSGKRRRTSEVDTNRETQDKITTMGAPIRLSTIQRNASSSKFVPGYVSATSSTQAGPTMLKTAIYAQHQAHHPKTPHDMAKYSSTRIPFADGPSGNVQQSNQRQQPGLLKTPATAHPKNPRPKSSPMYPDGDNISLPEIATDSEDEDSDDEGFVAPDWANSPALRELLSQQQLVDPVKVFGPIAPLQMEEIFRGNKERIVKFRKRTSSANWNGPDRLTEEERRKDFEARERLMKDGGWTFNPNI